MIHKSRLIFLLITLLATLTLACGLLSDINQVINSDVVKKALSIATQEGSQFISTLEALATQKGPGLVETSQALLDKYPGFQSTVISAATVFENNYGKSPADVPFLWGDKKEFYSDETTVSFLTDIKYKLVVDFFDSEMIASGWSKREDLSGIGENISVLVFEKDNRKASIDILSQNNRTLILILVSNR